MRLLVLRHEQCATLRYARPRRHLHDGADGAGSGARPHLAQSVPQLGAVLVELTEPTGHQLELLAAGAEDRSRLRDGLRQVTASTGSGSVCTVVEVAPWSRVPESRALLVPKDE